MVKMASNSEKDPLIRSLYRGIIVSCQADPASPLGNPQVLAALAAAAEQGGAVAIRANGPSNVAAIVKQVSIPVIAIYKQVTATSPVYITPTPQAARELVFGIDPPPAIIAFDATARPRPYGTTWQEVLQCIHYELHALAMADISSYEEGLVAAEAGADIIATTLSGYTQETAYKKELGGPDLELVAQLAATINKPILCEGRIRTPYEARLALEAGAWAVVVGTAITAIDRVTATFVEEMQRAKR